MVWSEQHETGNAQVDKEHKEIFAMVQKVIDAMFSNDGTLPMQSTLDYLANYTVEHFKHEEHLMKESNYPDLDTHKKLHDDFVAEVLALRDRVLSETDGNKNIADIHKVVVDWLMKHVMGSDKLMADHYRKWAESC